MWLKNTCGTLSVISGDSIVSVSQFFRIRTVEKYINNQSIKTDIYFLLIKYFDKNPGERYQKS